MLLLTGSIVITIVVVVSAHWFMKKPLVWEAYCAVLVLAICARSIGNYGSLTRYGFNAFFWGILLGMTVRAMGMIINKGVLNGEFFVKVGVVMVSECCVQ